MSATDNSTTGFGYNDAQSRKDGMSTRTITLILLTFFILLSAGFMYYYFKTNREVPKTLGTWGNEGHTIDTFTFVDQEGKTITKKDVDGKIFVAEYFFATCKTICPKMNENMARVYNEFRGNRAVLFLSHTVDPEHDSVPVLKAYSRQFNADAAQWHFLTGGKKRLYDMAYDSYYLTAKDTINSIEDAFIHAPYFILVDGKGHLRGRPYDGTKTASVDSLIEGIRSLLEERQRGNE